MSTNIKNRIIEEEGDYIMVIKVSGETPFQILSTTFSIGPSTSGYDLYFSADGVNYTQLFTVGANVNRQVTQVAAGSYYKLVGNTGNVVVNWYGNCVVDSGGGGGYVLPVASQSTLGGVKIGSGITIDSGGTISAQGGGSDENWTWYDVDEYNEMDSLERNEVYLEMTGMISSGITTFGFESNDSGEENAVSVKYPFWYKDLDNTLYFRGTSVTDADFEEGTAVFNADIIKLVRVADLEWAGWYSDSQTGGPRVILLNNLSQQELVDLYDEITAMYDYQNSAFTTAFTASDYEFYIDLTDSSKQGEIGIGDRNFEGWFPVVLNYVNPNDYDGGAIYFTGVEGRQDGNGYLFNIRYIVNNQGNTEAGCWTIEPPQPDYQHAIQVTSGGTFENVDGLSIFASENFNHKVMFVWREGNDQPGWGQAPLKYVWRKLDQDNHLIYHFAADNIPIDGVLYKGTWHVTEDDWGNYTTDTWTTV